jgi:hypothetical protein
MNWAGILLGVLLFVIGSIIYLIAMIGAGTARATGTTAILGWTVMNPLYWCGLVVALVIGVAIVKRRAKNRE